MPVAAGVDRPFAAVSLGTGGNASKCLRPEFEAGLIRLLGEHFRTLWIDRGAGGEEAHRVNMAAEQSGQTGKIRFWEESFAGFASLIAQAAFYAGYDSAGQHAAAAAGTPLVTVFAGAPSDRFRQRWAPKGPGPVTVIDADASGAPDTLARIAALLRP